MRKWIETMTLFMLLMMLLFLGTWQYYRLDWKQTILNNISTNANMEVVNFENILANGDDVDYRNVVISGDFDYDKVIFLYASHDSQQGYYVLNILRTEIGKNVLINRGWISRILKQNFYKDKNFFGFHKVYGQVIPNAFQKPRFAQISNDEVHNEWFWIDVSEISKLYGLMIENYVIWQTNNEAKDGLLIQHPVTQNIHNRHFEYMLTWYFLSLCLIIFIVYRAYMKYHVIIRR